MNYSVKPNYSVKIENSFSFKPNSKNRYSYSVKRNRNTILKYSVSFIPNRIMDLIIPIPIRFLITPIRLNTMRRYGWKMDISLAPWDGIFNHFFRYFFANKSSFSRCVLWISCFYIKHIKRTPPRARAPKSSPDHSNIYKANS